jgi:hypothetical protein
VTALQGIALVLLLLTFGEQLWAAVFWLIAQPFRGLIWLHNRSIDRAVMREQRWRQLDARPEEQRAEEASAYDADTRRLS